MDKRKMEKILKDTAYVRTGGSAEELKCAEYLKALFSDIGLEANLEEFEVDMADMKEAILWIDGKEVKCKGYLNAGCHDIEAPIYYLATKDAYSLKQCSGKIVLLDEGLKYWMFHDLIANGAVGFITYDGNANYADNDIDQKELRSYISNGRKMAGVNINAKAAIEIVKNNAKTARIRLEQKECQGKSYNVIAEMPGEIDEWIVVNAHYDSTSLSTGAYDNMSGCIGVLGIAENMVKNKHKYGLIFICHGSEERGLLGSKAYCKLYENNKKIVLNINMDMIGCIMGRLTAVCTSEEKLVHYIQYLANELGVGLEARDGIRSTDATVFADYGIPAVSFAHYAPANTTTIHNRYDSIKVMSLENLKQDIDFITAFTEHMVNAKQCPVAKEIPDKLKEKIDIYFNRKRS